jgi:hypothetical protein
MNMRNPMSTPKDETLELVLKGKLLNKVEIADTFRSAYRVLDKLCDGRYSRLRFIYGEDFEVSSELMEEFHSAAKEALAYKEALIFGRPIDTSIIGLTNIEHPATRKMASGLHDKD